MGPLATELLDERDRSWGLETSFYDRFDKDCTPPEVTPDDYWSCRGKSPLDPEP
jgi:hypothetical protein